VQQDELMFQTMLQVSACDLEWRKGVPNTFNSAKYEKDSLRLLWERLEDLVKASSDQIIGAVASMAALEVCPSF
jgi:hypothetical protein